MYRRDKKLFIADYCFLLHYSFVQVNLLQVQVLDLEMVHPVYCYNHHIHLLYHLLHLVCHQECCVLILAVMAVEHKIHCFLDHCKNHHCPPHW